MYACGLVLSRVSAHGRLEFASQKSGVGTYTEKPIHANHMITIEVVLTEDNTVFTKPIGCSEEDTIYRCSTHRYEYHWADGTTVKKPIKCSAPKYIDYLMTWVQEQLDDESIFPSKIGVFVWEHTRQLGLLASYVH